MPDPQEPSGSSGAARRDRPEPRVRSLRGTPVVSREGLLRDVRGESGTGGTGAALQSHRTGRRSCAPMGRTALAGRGRRHAARPHLTDHPRDRWAVLRLLCGGPRRRAVREECHAEFDDSRSEPLGSSRERNPPSASTHASPGFGRGFVVLGRGRVRVGSMPKRTRGAAAVTRPGARTDDNAYTR
jgi:hypothetical protein